MAAGLGLAYFRLPVLTIEDEGTGASKLQNHAGAGPFLGLNVAYYLDPHADLGAEFIYLPTLPNMMNKNATGKSTTVYLYWRQVFARNLFLELGLNSTRESLTVKVDCPAVAGCRNSSVSSSTLFQAQMGIGYQF